MSRARNIKPGFFKNDLLAECNPLARILFTGLWCEADREGRLEDRPKRLKADCLPYDDCDVGELLNELADREFITRYECDGKKYIAVNEFLKHQNPHAREVPSSIPAPASTKHNQGSDNAQPRQCLGDDKPQPSIGSAGLIPDSPSLIPDSLQKQKGGKPPALTLPAWLPESAWADWHVFRNQRKGWTHKARELSLATLTKLRKHGHDPTQVIEQSIERGWTGLFEIKPEVNHGNHAAGSRESTAERAARFAREGDEADARRAAGTDPRYGHATVLAADGRDLRLPLDVGVR
jgi:hypothetical protein